jgi:hypothetical protein
MHRLIALLASLAMVAAAQAGEVFMTKDAQGNTVYTDRPESLPAKKVAVATRSTDNAAVQQQYTEKMQANATSEQAKAEAAKQAGEAKQAKEMTAADKAKRCLDARNRYEQVMNAQRLFEPGEKEGERRYLDAKEIDAARAAHKKAMDDFCSGQ